MPQRKVGESINLFFIEAMEWFSGDISECIKEVKTKKALFLVLSKGMVIKILFFVFIFIINTDQTNALISDSTSALSSEILEALGSQDVARLCQGMVCESSCNDFFAKISSPLTRTACLSSGLQLDAGTTPYIQFSSIYEVPSVPCIHLIPPTGEILSVKTTDFSAENLAQWLGENAEKFGESY